jgi:GH25 family lysozyme M1 (1,4-beta-N-acetylmuramidase)
MLEATRATSLCLALVAGGCVLGACSDSQERTGHVQQAAEVCSSGDTTFGIDVSRYQGSIDWAQLAGADVKFAYIQISRKIDDIDPKFEINWQAAKDVGILRGAYQRFQPDEDVIGQADIFLEKLGPFEEGDLPPMLDVEDSGGLGADMIALHVRQWLTYVEAQLGVRPIIYTGRFFWRDTLESADFTEYPLWIAHYTDGCPTIPEPWQQWALHQYSSQAVLPGITENTVDVNHFNGTVSDLLALASWRRCGNDVCDAEESNADCPEDCAPPATAPDAGVLASDAGTSEEPEDTGEGGGCALSGSGEPGLAVLLLGLLAWLRKPRNLV